MANDLEKLFIQINDETNDISKYTPSDQKLSDNNYIIFITPRSGSTFLTFAIAKQGNLGNPNEWLNYNSSRVLKLMKDNSICNIADYFDFSRRQHKSPNGVFGIEISWPQFRCAEELIDLRAMFGGNIKWFFLRRRNLVAQSISSYIASTTGIYHSYQLKEYDEINKIDIEYDADNIKRRAKLILGQEIAILDYCDTEQIHPIDIYYEDIIQDTKKFMYLFRNVLGVYESDQFNDSNPIHKVSTGRNEDWEARFREEEPEYIRDLLVRRPNMMVPKECV